MKQSTKRLLSSFLSLMLLAGAFVVFFAFIRPLYDDIAGVRAEQASRNDFVLHQQSVVKQVKDLMATYEGGKELRDVISLVLPLDPDLGGALAALNGLMTQNGVDPQSFSVTIGPADAGGVGAKGAAASLMKPFGSVQVQMRFLANYDHLKGFLGDMETNIRLFDVKSMSLQPAGKVTQDLYTVDLTVAAYYQIN